MRVGDLHERELRHRQPRHLHVHEERRVTVLRGRAHLDAGPGLVGGGPVRHTEWGPTRGTTPSASAAREVTRRATAGERNGMSQATVKAASPGAALSPE